MSTKLRSTLFDAIRHREEDFARNVNQAVLQSLKDLGEDKVRQMEWAGKLVEPGSEGFQKAA